MLLFISFWPFQLKSQLHFNTSHVTVYLSSKFPVIIPIVISIHLMLLFITTLLLRSRWLTANFNTSHVTVYLCAFDRWPVISIFQYISCYCLSAAEKPEYLLPYPFQYISCYCLSWQFHHQYCNLVNFNTSHVTVYQISGYANGTPGVFQYISCYCLSVTPIIRTNSRYISIHLMLLFIQRGQGKEEWRIYFNTSHVTVYRYHRCRQHQV